PAACSPRCTRAAGRKRAARSRLERTRSGAGLECEEVPSGEANTDTPDSSRLREVSVLMVAVTPSIEAGERRGDHARPNFLVLAGAVLGVRARPERGERAAPTPTRRDLPQRGRLFRARRQRR